MWNEHCKDQKHSVSSSLFINHDYIRSRDYVSMVIIFYARLKDNFYGMNNNNIYVTFHDHSFEIFIMKTWQ